MVATVFKKPSGVLVLTLMRTEKNVSMWYLLYSQSKGAKDLEALKEIFLLQDLQPQLSTDMVKMPSQILNAL